MYGGSLRLLALFSLANVPTVIMWE